jgi:hypothetical protein
MSYVERPGWAVHRRTGAVTPVEGEEGWWWVVAYDGDTELVLKIDAPSAEFARARAAGFR